MGIYSDHYKTLCEQLSEMALQGILSYREFNLREEGKWALGLYNPHVVVLNEKTADDIGLKFIQDQIGISYLATGGQPSTLTMEYFTHALKKKLDALDEMPPLVIIAIVDYDPYGWLLRETAINAMINFGLPRPDAVINIALPKNYPQDLLHFLKNDLTKGKYKVRPAILRKWMKITNGIDGEPFGIPINYLWEDLENIKNLVLDDAKPYLLLQPPMPTRPWEEVTMHMEQLHELAMFTIQKMMRRTKACKK